MADTFTIGVYWKTRQETLEEAIKDSAKRLSRLLTDIQSLPLPLQNWFLKSRSPLKKVPIDNNLEYIEALMADKTQDFVGSSQVVSSAGITLGFWNGNETSSAGMTISCCTFSSRLTNACVIDLDFTLNPQIGYAIAMNLLRMLAYVWEPQNGVVISTQFRRQTRLYTVPMVGWITYFSDLRFLPTLPDFVQVEKDQNDGGFLVATTDTFDSENIQHTENLRQLIETLVEHNVVKVD